MRFRTLTSRSSLSLVLLMGNCELRDVRLLVHDRLSQGAVVVQLIDAQRAVHPLPMNRFRVDRCEGYPEPTLVWSMALTDTVLNEARAIGTVELGVAPEGFLSSGPMQPLASGVCYAIGTGGPGWDRSLEFVIMVDGSVRALRWRTE